MNKNLIIFLLCSLFSKVVLASQTNYIVQKNDTLVSILETLDYGQGYADLLGFIDQIAELNKDKFSEGNVNFLSVGMKLVLPVHPDYVEPEPEPEPEPELEPEPEPEPEPTIGYLSIGKGTAHVIRSGESIVVSQNLDLLSNDDVSTGDHSLAEITLNDETVFQLGANSSININEFSFIPKPNNFVQPEGSLVAKIGGGVVRTISGLLSKLKTNEYAVLAPFSSTMGVRGTDFTVRSCMDETICGDLFGVSVAVQDGGISFENSAAAIDLDQNEFTQVQSADETPVAAPVPEGFFDLELDVKEIKKDKNLIEVLIDKVMRWFEG